MVYIVIALSFGFAGGFVGKIKGSSFLLWFIISATFPIVGLAAAVLYRFDTDEPRRHCPTCGHVCMLHDALCTRCGTELDFPDESEILPPVAPA
ncbi:MAG TPA: hypothetical protein VFY45_20665 [Baekduia sp.]|jgi:hypothetical protein|nr:hypothetical protein [Baekduia sp.]